MLLWKKYFWILQFFEITSEILTNATGTHYTEGPHWRREPGGGRSKDQKHRNPNFDKTEPKLEQGEK